MSPRASVTLHRAHAHGRLTLELWPECGGSIAAFSLEAADGTLPLFRPATAGARTHGDATELASFPLVPYSNRIRDGRFDFAGRRHQLAQNFPPVAHPLHGHGWQSVWSVGAQTDDAVELTLGHPPDDWPWRYVARQRLELDEHGLRQELSLRNDSPQPMPAGLGLHPYFVRSPTVRLQAKLPAVWLTSPDCLPLERLATPAAWDFASGRRVDEVELDHCFSGWDGRAVIDWPERRLRLHLESAPPLDKLVLYVPPAADFFCVEPVSHIPDAINLYSRGIADTGARVLLPGETLTTTTRFLIERDSCY